MTEARAGAEAYIAELQVEVERLKDEWRKADNGWIAANAEVERLQKACNEWDVTCANLWLKIERLKLELSDLHRDYKTAAEERTRWRDRVEELHIEGGTVKGNLAASERRVKQLREEIDQHVPCAECINEREKAEAERDDYKDRWEVLGRVAKKILDKRTVEVDGLKEDLAGAVDALEQIRDTVRMSSVKKHAADRCEEIAKSALQALKGKDESS